MNADESNTREYSRDALDHAWRWFELHARQRLQLVNFFLLSAAFLSSAYAVALDAGRLEVAAIIGAAGVVSAISFRLIEARVSRLIKASECAMAESEGRLAALTEIPEIDLVRTVEDPGTMWKKYSMAVRLVHWTFGLAFAMGVAYALLEYLDCA